MHFIIYCYLLLCRQFALATVDMDKGRDYVRELNDVHLLSVEPLSAASSFVYRSPPSEPVSLSCETPAWRSPGKCNSNVRPNT